MKLAFNVLGALAVVAFVAGLVAGFTVDVHPPGSTIDCGAPLEVVDGGFAEGVPNELESACQSAANRWLGYSMIPFFVFFLPALVLGFNLRGRGDFSKNRLS